MTRIRSVARAFTLAYCTIAFELAIWKRRCDHAARITLPVAAMITILMGVATSSLAGPADDDALTHAAFDLDVSGVKAALKSGANPNALWRNNRQFTALGCVMTVHGGTDNELKAFEIAKTLFAAGAKLGPADSKILFFPIANGYLDLVRLLIERGASPTETIDGYSPTELAKKYDHLAVYDYLVSRGGIPIGSREAAQVALIEAAGSALQGWGHDVGAAAKMEKAVEQGARIDGTDPTGKTALIEAVRLPIFYQTQADSVRWLLDHGADPNQKGDSGYQGVEGLPLHIFVVMNAKPSAGTPSRPRPDAKPIAEEVLARLLAAGAKVSGMDSQGRTPLHLAAREDNVWAAEVLIKEGAKVMARDTAEKTPLDYAESAQMIKLLKANGATER